MCERCDMDRSWDGEFAEALRFDGPSLDYHDGPIAGWLCCDACGQWYAFYCEEVVFHWLWHWSLQPTREKSPDDPRTVLRSTDGAWISVLEDRRRAPGTHCSGARLERPRARPPVPAP